MKNIIKLEEAAMFGLSIYVLYWLQAEWWWYLILVIGPDISMLGYLAGNKAGAACYNLFHHKGVAVAVFVTGFIIATFISTSNWYRFIRPFFHGQVVWLWIENK